MKTFFVLALLLLFGCKSEQISSDHMPPVIENGTTVILAGSSVELYGYDKCDDNAASGCIILYGRTYVPVITVGSDDVHMKEVWKIEASDNGRIRINSRRIIHPDGSTWLMDGNDVF